MNDLYSLFGQFLSFGNVTLNYNFDLVCSLYEIILLTARF
jgi:hypothetical protein